MGICFPKVIVLAHGDVWGTAYPEMNYKLLKNNWIIFDVILV